MYLVKVTWRVKNDYHWLGKCEFCGYELQYNDGYADHHYATKIIPDRECSKCGKKGTDATQTPERNQDVG